MSDPIAECINDIVSMHDDRLRLLKEAAGPKINWLSIGTPEEVFYAARLIPYRLTGETRSSFPRAGAYMHRNLCPYVLSCFEEQLDGIHDFSSGTIIVNACDARRRLYDVWKYFVPSTFLHLLDFPRVVNEDTRKYFKNQVRRLITALENRFHCTVTDDGLREAMALCNETRSLLRELNELRIQGVAPVTGTQANRIVRAAMTGLRGDFNRRLSRLLQLIKNREAPATDRRRYRVLICGSYFDHTPITDIFDRYGADIVAQDVSTGIKYFEGAPNAEGDPVEALANYYLERASCARMIDGRQQFDRLWQLVESSGAQSVVYFTLKFCDNNLFNFPFQKERLNERGIPVFFIEAERSVENIEQIKTRIAAFLESQMG